MYLVVLPMSAASSGTMTPGVIANGLLIHMIGVGLPGALFARAAHPITSGFRRIWD
jgi:hypothetical protein